MFCVISSSLPWTVTCGLRCTFPGGLSKALDRFAPLVELVLYCLYPYVIPSFLVWLRCGLLLPREYLAGLGCIRNTAGLPQTGRPLTRSPICGAMIPAPPPATAQFHRLCCRRKPRGHTLAEAFSDPRIPKWMRRGRRTFSQRRFLHGRGGFAGNYIPSQPFPRAIAPSLEGYWPLHGA